MYTGSASLEHKLTSHQVSNVSSSLGPDFLLLPFNCLTRGLTKKPQTTETTLLRQRSILVVSTH